MNDKILIVDDDLLTAEMEKDYLELSGFNVLIEPDGEKGLGLALHGGFQLLILDIILPNIDGYEICKRIREVTELPIIIVSAENKDLDKIRGLGAGANDYVTKPFSPSELVARVKAHLERYKRLVQSCERMENEVLTMGGLTIDHTARRVYVDGEEKSLTTKEFDLLFFLAKNPNRVFSKEELLRYVWELDPIGADIATVTVHIKKIREKIEEDTQNPKYIETVWAVGYRFIAKKK